LTRAFRRAQLEAKFVHLWKREAVGWRLVRVLSFDQGTLALRKWKKAHGVRL